MVCVKNTSFPHDLCLAGMVYRATEPPPPQSDQSPDNPPGNSPRIKLRDGRYLAYREHGVPKNQSKYSVILVHGFGSSKEMNFLAPQGMIEELGIYFLLYDRAGYGESDPNRRQSVKE
ncbi:hypothetical protein OIU76_015780 [Salix suchowensis]|nr:hypothetical protein OIU76_015780 [Salix suchowensis]